MSTKNQWQILDVLLGTAATKTRPAGPSYRTIHSLDRSQRNSCPRPPENLTHGRSSPAPARSSMTRQRSHLQWAPYDNLVYRTASLYSTTTTGRKTPLPLRLAHLRPRKRLGKESASSNVVWLTGRSKTARAEERRWKLGLIFSFTMVPRQNNRRCRSQEINR